MSSIQNCNKKEILQVDHLRIEYPTRKGVLVPVDDISFSVREGEILAIVGESGAGKSMSGMAIINLLEPPGEIARGNVVLNGRRIDNLPAQAMQKVRGGEIGVIFQDPLTSLNPLFTIGKQLVQTITTHTDLSAFKAKKRAVELLNEVGISGADSHFDSYPHEFSGGMRQRVVIALALCAGPKLIIADEPTTALDVSIQAQILSLLKTLCREHQTAIILITHDMGVVRKMADRVAVMYAGRIVEVGSVDAIIKDAKHPYTSGLMKCIPNIGSTVENLHHIAGSMPRLLEIPTGCAFHPRCSMMKERCRTERPELIPLEENHEAACLLFDKERTDA